MVFIFSVFWVWISYELCAFSIQFNANFFFFPHFLHGNFDTINTLKVSDNTFNLFSRIRDLWSENFFFLRPKSMPYDQTVILSMWPLETYVISNSIYFNFFARAQSSHCIFLCFFCKLFFLFLLFLVAVHLRPVCRSGKLLSNNFFFFVDLVWFVMGFYEIFSTFYFFSLRHRHIFICWSYNCCILLRARRHYRHYWGDLHNLIWSWKK